MPALSQGGEYRVGFQGWQGLSMGWVYVVGTPLPLATLLVGELPGNPVEGSLGTVTACLPWPPSPTLTDSALGPPLAGPSGPLQAVLALGFLPIAACPPGAWVGLSGQADMVTGSPHPLLTPRPQSETPTQGLASCSQGRQFVLCPTTDPTAGASLVVIS